MFDIKKIQAEAEAEIAAERGDVAKRKLKEHLRKIDAAKKVLANLELEYEVLLRDIAV